MTRPTRPEVHDSELSQALNSVGDHIENYAANLDAISYDIKKIEEYLTASGIRVEAHVVINRESEDTRFYSEESIAWRPMDRESERRWRLMYRRLFGLGEEELKPLIETSVEVRLRAHRLLPELVLEVGNLVKVRPMVVPWELYKEDDSEIPD